LNQPVIFGILGFMHASSQDPGLNGVQLVYHPACLQHDSGFGHPESPERLRGILAALRQRGINEDDLQRPDPVDLGLLAEVHDERYIAAVEEVARRGGAYWDADTLISPGSYEAALVAAGAAVGAVDAVMRGDKHAAFALVRPPGHHALRASAMGFCLFNNIGVAAQHAVRDHALERVLIVDWDVHHGNGTQDLFYSRPDVLFFSTHQYPFYPGTGAIDETGAGAGEGYTVNVPLPAGVGDGGYKQVFEQVLVPLARRFRPQLILISAGYDAHVLDPLAGMAVTMAGFSEMALTVSELAGELCDGRVAAVLEGGYNIEALSMSVLTTIGALGVGGRSGVGETELENDIPPLGSYSLGRAPDISHIIAQVKRIHKLE
jgi:acetoin utilization deacetylase AcuC-like enzyme